MNMSREPLIGELALRLEAEQSELKRVRALITELQDVVVRQAGELVALRGDRGLEIVVDHEGREYHPLSCRCGICKDFARFDEQDADRLRKPKTPRTRKFSYTDNGDEYHALVCKCAMCAFYEEKRKNLNVPLLERCEEDAPPVAG